MPGRSAGFSVRWWNPRSIPSTGPGVAVLRAACAAVPARDEGVLRAVRDALSHARKVEVACWDYTLSKMAYVSGGAR